MDFDNCQNVIIYYFSCLKSPINSEYIKKNKLGI